MKTEKRIKNYKYLADGNKVSLKLVISDVLKIITILLFVFPFYWMITTAFKTYAEAIQKPPTFWPSNWSLEGFQSVFNSGLGIDVFAKNSIVVTAMVVGIQILVMVPAAYAFAKKKFPMKGFFFGIVLVAFMIAQQFTYIPVYLMMSKSGLINSLWPQIIPLGADAFGIFMLRQAFMQIPDEIVESAKLDNASELKIMWRVILPMCASTMATIAAFSFIGTWNSYFWPLVMTQSDEYRPLTLMVERLRDAEVGTRWNTLMAGNTLLILPVVFLFIFVSKRIVDGITYKGEK